MLKEQETTHTHKVRMSSINPQRIKIIIWELVQERSLISGSFTWKVSEEVVSVIRQVALGQASFTLKY